MNRYDETSLAHLGVMMPIELAHKIAMPRPWGVVGTKRARFDLLPESRWQLNADRETWLFILSGAAKVGNFDVELGDAIFAQSDRVSIQSGSIGVKALVAYAGPDRLPNLLQPLDLTDLSSPSPQDESESPPPFVATLSRPEKRRARVTP